MAGTSTQILDLAERAIRSRGYHAVSFRDLADEMGIKSASIHYHFRHKEDLGLAVVDRYAEAIQGRLGPAGARPWPDALASFCEVYRDALQKSGLQCLCGMLAAESRGLPDKVAERVARFFRENIEWLVASMPQDLPHRPARAMDIQCALQGAMTVAVSLDEPEVLDRIIARLLSEYAGRA